LETTNVFDKNFESEKRLVINQGGTSSSKTWSILQILLIHAVKRDNLVISVVSETLPHIKRGAMRDFMIMLKNEGLYNQQMHDKTNNAFHFGSSFIEFFGADSDDKVRGPRRDILFLNECNNVNEATFDQLEVRTKERIYLDYNPTHEFWAHELMNYRDDYDYIHSTYLDNDLLDERIKKSIEQRKNNQNWWKVYGRGEIGQLEGVVFHNWQQIDKYPDDLKWEIYGLDFGYSNDPTTIIRIGFKEGKLYLDEMLYQTGLTNNEIAGFIKNKIGRATIIADSAEPKSIEEIYRHGIDIRGAEKGKDSILFGIDLLQEYHMKVTKRSINIIKELRNYTWDKDKNGKQLNKPIDMFNHGIDALRYAATYKLRKKRNLYEPV
jgi:phage terminase large subunit